MLKGGRFNLREENTFLKWLKKLWKQDQHPNDKNQKKKPTLYFYLLTVLVLGVLFMMVSDFFAEQSEETSSADTVPVFEQEATEDVETFGDKGNNSDKTIADYERSFENAVKEALEAIDGVSDVSIVVNVEATEKKVYQKNRVNQKQITDETDREGGKRTVEDISDDEQVVIVRNGDQEVPVVQETRKPEVRGVLVVAKGADNITVKKWIVEAVTRVLDIPTHRVAVMPKK